MQDRPFVKGFCAKGVRLFKSIDRVTDYGTGAAAVAAPADLPTGSFGDTARQLIGDWHDDLADTEWAPDLGQDIGSLTWFRGLTTLGLLCGFAISCLPDFGPIAGHQSAPLIGSRADQARSQMIAPLAYGGDTGVSMAATDAVRPLAQSPERPSVELVATLGRGDSLRRVDRKSAV